MRVFLFGLYRLKMLKNNNKILQFTPVMGVGWGSKSVEAVGWYLVVVVVFKWQFNKCYVRLLASCSTSALFVLPVVVVACCTVGGGGGGRSSVGGGGGITSYANG